MNFLEAYTALNLNKIVSIKKHRANWFDVSLLTFTGKSHKKYDLSRFRLWKNTQQVDFQAHKSTRACLSLFTA